MLMWWEMVKTYLRCQRGQGMVEYGLIIALVAVALVGALTLMKSGLSDLFDSVKNSVSGTGGTGGTGGTTSQ